MHQIQYLSEFLYLSGSGLLVNLSTQIKEFSDAKYLQTLNVQKSRKKNVNIHQLFMFKCDFFLF